MVIRGPAPASAPADLAVRPATGSRRSPGSTAGGPPVVNNWFEMWDMATLIIAPVHPGYCLAGSSELAAACDLVYVAEDALVGTRPCA